MDNQNKGVDTQELQRQRNAARDFLQAQFKEVLRAGAYQATALNNEHAVTFAMQAGNMDSDSAKLYHSVQHQLKDSGGVEGRDYKTTIDGMVKPGETSYRIDVTFKHLKRAQGYKRPVEIQLEKFGAPAKPAWTVG